jgi:hypothetical protein
MSGQGVCMSGIQKDGFMTFGKFVVCSFKQKYGVERA